MSSFDPGLFVKTIHVILRILTILFLLSPFSHAQKIEEKDGVRIIHNEKGGKWGSKPEVSLRLIRTIGGIDIDDENLAFHFPYDVAFDTSDNIYILDEGNNRIQKLSPEGKYLATIGRRGQGPGEFQSPFSLDIDSKGYLYVSEGGSRRIQILTPEGKVYKTIKNTKYLVLKLRHLPSGLIATAGYQNISLLGETKAKTFPKLIKILDLKGNLQNEFGDMHDYRNNLVNSLGNRIDYDISREGNFFITFSYQNRIEKHSPEGMLLWRADRQLNYSTEPISMGHVERKAEGGTTPQLNYVSNGIAVDSKGRAWIATLNRQPTREEEGEVISAPGARRVKSSAELEKIDAYKLEIFDPDGILLGEMPLDHRVHGMRIYKNYLFTWERNFAKYYQYEIIEK
jgi:DNA-binding beta-propeller fold protein YncE